MKERAAEASAARQRSVDRFLYGKEGAAAAAGDAVSNGEATPPREVHDAAEHLPVEDAAELAPEEPPPAVRLRIRLPDTACSRVGRAACFGPTRPAPLVAWSSPLIFEAHNFAYRRERGGGHLPVTVRFAFLCTFYLLYLGREVLRTSWEQYLTPS